VYCHWYQWEEPIPADIEPFDELSTLVIGTPMPQWAFKVNPNCTEGRPGYALTVSRQDKPLGTSATKMVVDKQAFNVGFSKMVVLGYSFDLKPKPGLSYHSMLAFHWAKENEHPNPRSLDLHVGLEISACTGNAQRVAIWELFQLDVVKNYVTEVLPDQLPEYQGNDEGDTENNTSGTASTTSQPSKEKKKVPSFLHAFDNGFENFIKLWRNEPFNKSARIIICNLMQKLASTGLTGDGSLDAWRVSKSMKCWTISGNKSYNWMKMLGHTYTEAALCIISDRCLECSYEDGIGCSLRHQPYNDKSQRTTALRTALHLDKKRYRETLKKRAVPLKDLPTQELFRHSQRDQRAQEDLLTDLQDSALEAPPMDRQASAQANNIPSASALISSPTVPVSLKALKRRSPADNLYALFQQVGQQPPTTNPKTNQRITLETNTPSFVTSASTSRHSVFRPHCINVNDEKIELSEAVLGKSDFGYPVLVVKSLMPQNSQKHIHWIKLCEKDFISRTLIPKDGLTYREWIDERDEREILTVCVL
jgi:hypothetical protein